MTDWTAVELVERALAQPATEVIEVRLVGDTGEGYATYDFTWRGETALAEALEFLALDGVQSGIKNPRLLRRTVTTTAWAEPVPEPIEITLEEASEAKLHLRNARLARSNGDPATVAAELQRYRDIIAVARARSAESGLDPLRQD